MLQTYSPDVLSLNPDLAAKSSKAKTPSGKGYGHTDNEQAYPATPYNPAQLMRDASKVALALIRRHAERAGWTGEGVVRQADKALDELVKWLA